MDGREQSAGRRPQQQGSGGGDGGSGGGGGGPSGRFRDNNFDRRRGMSGGPVPM